METKHEKRFAVVGQGTIFDGIAYWAILIGVYLMVGGLMFYSGKEKLFDDNGNAPQAIKTQFAGTFIDTFPGADAAWVILGILEFGVFVLLVASVLRLEFLPHREKWLLQCGLAVALLDLCLSRVRPDGHAPVLGDRLALHVLRLDGRDPHPREHAAAEPSRPLAQRRGAEMMRMRD